MVDFNGDYLITMWKISACSSFLVNVNLLPVFCLNCALSEGSLLLRILQPVLRQDGIQMSCKYTNNFRNLLCRYVKHVWESLTQSYL